jgi:hypothetical protein
MEEIPYELQMEISYHLHEFIVLLDADMHPDAEIGQAQFIYLCCAMKNTSTPPIGVAVPKDYPKTPINFKEMDVSAFDKTDPMRKIKKHFGEILLHLGAEYGCSLTTVFQSWREAAKTAVDPTIHSN